MDKNRHVDTDRDRLRAAPDKRTDVRHLAVVIAALLLVAAVVWYLV